MTQDRFDRVRFGPYNRNEPLHLARFQRTVGDFMVLLRDDVLTLPNDQKLLDEFCNFVNDSEVWHLAQTVTPEFRLAKEDQHRDSDTKDGPTALSYVLNKLTLLPPPRSDKNVLTSEQIMLNQRHKQWVEYAVTGGRGRLAATPEQQAECAERISHIENAVKLVQVQDPVQSTSESATGNRRNDQDNAGGPNVSTEQGNEEAKKGTEKAAMDNSKEGKEGVAKRVDKGPNNVGQGRKKGKTNERVEEGPMDTYIKTTGRKD